MKTYWLLGVAAAILAACSQGENHENGHETAATTTEPKVAKEAMTAAENGFDAARLEAVLAAQPEDVQARYQYRHPLETLKFFGIAPGMTVVEALPGGGWYSKILLPYLGAEGKLVGADYSVPMWSLFGGFANEAFLKAKETWPTDWPQGAQDWRGEDAADVTAFAFGNLPEEMKGTADAVLLFRALHHFSRFEDQGGFYTQALDEMMAVLKPGGIVGIVQHRAPETNSDKWADGNNGYLKQAHVIERFKAAGFEFVGSSEINANAKDQPSEEDFVWRLPPVLTTSRDNPELRAKYEAIGESDRMTLLFRKPS